MDYPKRIIKVGEADTKIVKAIQKKLIELGIANFEATGTFGPKTKSAVQQFQATHTDQNGNPLEMDGKIGSITWAILFGDDAIPVAETPKGDLLTEVIKVAASQVGVIEIPPNSNRGPEVDAYLDSTGTPHGSYWCAAFVYWCFNEASRNLGIANPAVITAGCIDHWNRTKAKKITKQEAINSPSKVKPGQIFILDFGGGRGHTGLIEKVEGGFIHTIEGNSNNDGSRNGIGVFRVVRKISKITKGYIEYK